MAWSRLKGASMPEARTSVLSPEAWYRRRGQSSAARRSGCGKIESAHSSVACALSGARTRFRSSWARVASRSCPKGTPDGQAVSQARQPRQRSRWRASPGVSSARPSAAARMR